MGYVTKDIAVITEPRQLSLSAAPNFVQFASKAAAKTFLEINIQVNAAAAPAAPATLLRITEPSGAIDEFIGTTNAAIVGGNTFFISADQSDTAENLREVLLANRWIAAHFDINIFSVLVSGLPTNGRTLNIKSKGTGAEYNATFAAPDNTANAGYTITTVHAASVNDDSISGEDVTAEIELDIYLLNLRLGADDKPTNAATLGTLALTMQKSYAGVPLWFDVNAIFNQYQNFNIPPLAGWFDTGTAKVFRFVARKKGVNSFAFYLSSALYALSGYSYASEDIDLLPYVYTAVPIKLLTNKPRTPYMRGQREFLNFILGDASATAYDLKIVYKAYTTADVLLGSLDAHVQAHTAFSTVNTCVLNIDALLDIYGNAGIVRVALARGATIVSNYLEYMVRPPALHTLTQFTFLNRLGGWDAFNFDAAVKYDIKPNVETYAKTLTPAFKKGGSIETVYTSALDDTRTVEGAPVTDDVADWLMELAASRVVLDGDGNYVIKEDFTLSISSASANMQTPIIKYRLSETYTND